MNVHFHAVEEHIPFGEESIGDNWILSLNDIAVPIGQTVEIPLNEDEYTLQLIDRFGTFYYFDYRTLDINLLINYLVTGIPLTFGVRPVVGKNSDGELIAKGSRRLVDVFMHKL